MEYRMSDDRQQQRRRPMNRRPMRKKGPSCPFCADKGRKINYKDVDSIRYFLTERGKIKGRRKSGTCAKHQRRLAIAIKRARHLALLPFTAEHLRRF